MNNVMRAMYRSNGLRFVYRNLIPEFVKSPFYKFCARIWPNHFTRSWELELETRREFIRRAFMTLHMNKITGDYAEFGCCGGNTFRLAYHESRKQKYNCMLWAFDSFQGLPAQAVPEDSHPNWIQGVLCTTAKDFKRICKKSGLQDSDYRMIEGFYDETLKPSARDNNRPTSVAFAYIDCDLYSSTKTVLNFLATRIRQGTIVAFDDYFCYASDALSGERLACAEFLKENPNFHFSPYCQYSWGGMSFIVEDRKLWKTVDPSILP
jgi:O-methyltransferase